MNNYKIIFFICFLISIQSAGSAFAEEKELIKLADFYYENREYYNAITETMRYQFLYPNGKYYPKSMLIMSKAYSNGGNYSGALNTLTECYKKYRNMPEGEEALYMIGYTRLTMGSPYFAYRSYQEYQYIYREGRFNEDVAYDLCMTLVLLKDSDSAKKAIDDYEGK